MNDRLIARIGQRRGSLPAHVIAPPRRLPNPERGSPQLRSGRIEVLPPVCCQGLFRSAPLSAELESVLYVSRLAVAWFQEDFAFTTDGVTAAVRDVPWESLAIDSER